MAYTSKTSSIVISFLLGVGFFLVGKKIIMEHSLTLKRFALKIDFGDKSIIAGAAIGLCGIVLMFYAVKNILHKLKHQK